MKNIAYHRTSTKEQKLDRGLHEIKVFVEQYNIKLYKDKIYTDQQTGKNFNRPSYTIIKEELLEPGDTLIITELDRLGRTKKDTLQELYYYKEKNIRVMILELPTTLIDISQMDNSLSGMILETINNMMVELYAALAEAEMMKKEKRQREGIERMKANGEWERYGRPVKMKQVDFNKQYETFRGKGMNPGAIMKKLDMQPTTYYRYKGKYLDEKSKKLADRIMDKGYQLSKYDQDHIKMLLSESNSLGEEAVVNIVIDGKKTIEL